MKKIIIVLALLPVITNAGVRALTIHSRANCANNESISWHLNNPHELKTISVHRKQDRWGSYSHVVETPWKNTWRSAAVCWGEGYSGWSVVGYHYIRERGTQKLLGRTTATNCNLDRGWWNY